MASEIDVYLSILVLCMTNIYNRRDMLELEIKLTGGKDL